MEGRLSDGPQSCPLLVFMPMYNPFFLHVGWPSKADGMSLPRQGFTRQWFHPYKQTLLCWPWWSKKPCAREAHVVGTWAGPPANRQQEAAVFSLTLTLRICEQPANNHTSLEMDPSIVKSSDETSPPPNTLNSVLERPTQSRGAS